MINYCYYLNLSSYYQDPYRRSCDDDMAPSQVFTTILKALGRPPGRKQVDKDVSARI